MCTLYKHDILVTWEACVLYMTWVDMNTVNVWYCLRQVSELKCYGAYGQFPFNSKLRKTLTLWSLQIHTVELCYSTHNLQEKMALTSQQQNRVLYRDLIRLNTLRCRLYCKTPITVKINEQSTFCGLLPLIICSFTCWNSVIFNRTSV